MTNIHKIANVEIYNVFISRNIYEVEIRTDSKGKKTFAVEDTLRKQISNEI